jgi:hypothetical protein
MLLTKSEVWWFTSLGFWYAFKQKSRNSDLPLKKLFSYKGKRYTSKELTKMGIISEW